MCHDVKNELPDFVEISTDGVPLAGHVLKHHLHTRGGGQSLKFKNHNES